MTDDHRRRLDGGDQGAEVPASPAPERDLCAAVAAAALGSEERFRALLRSVVEVARAIFAAKASSILLLDEQTNELVFEAVVGEGEESLLGQRFPAGTGVAGWVLATRTPLVIEDVARDPRFAKEVAEGTGYVPQGLMAVPLLHDEQALGVLEVLDRQARFTLEEMELLGLFASQAAIALDLLRRARAAEAALAGDGDLVAVARLAAALGELDEETRPGAQALLESLETVLRHK
jgi:GAF domain-containing protein